MPQKKSPMNLWKSMDKKDIRRLAVAVFFLFGTIGPLTMLMETLHFARLMVHAVLSYCAGRNTFSMYYFVYKKTLSLFIHYCW